MGRLLVYFICCCCRPWNSSLTQPFSVYSESCHLYSKRKSCAGQRGKKMVAFMYLSLALCSSCHTASILFYVVDSITPLNGLPWAGGSNAIKLHIFAFTLQLIFLWFLMTLMKPGWLKDAQGVAFLWDESCWWENLKDFHVIERKMGKCQRWN